MDHLQPGLQLPADRRPRCHGRPGAHGPIREARPGTRVDIQLSAGLHKFDYYHAAAGDHAATMLVAWVPGPTSDKDCPSALPDDIFAQRLVGHLPAGA